MNQIGSLFLLKELWAWGYKNFSQKFLGRRHMEAVRKNFMEAVRWALGSVMG